jgi:hypothetical protein
MSWRHRLAFGVLVSLVAAAGLRLALPGLIRAAVVTRVHAVTGRAATLDAVDVAVLQGRVSLRGFRLADRTSEREPFAELDRLDIQLRPLALLLGHLWLREVVLSEPTVRVIRYPGNDINLSDLFQSVPSGATHGFFDVTVDRFVVVNGTSTIEDRALPEPRTWRSEAISIEAHDLSTRPQYGTLVATSVIGGAPVSVRAERLRLSPVDLDATVTIDGFDLAMARVYLPSGTPVQVDGGRGSTALHLSLDANAGLRLDGTARVEGIVLTRQDGGALARVPTLTATLDGLQFGPERMAVGRLALDVSGAVIDPAAGSADRFAPMTLRARVSDLTWPIDRPAGLDLSTRVQGRGSLSVTGALNPPTAPSQLRVRLEDFDLAPWARFSPLAQRLTGVAQADVRVDEPLRVGVPSRVRGTAAVENAGVWEGAARLLGAQRIEASELELGWPDRLRIGRLTIREPRAVVERGRTGEVALGRLLGSSPGPDSSPSASDQSAGAVPSSRGPALAVHIDKVLLQDGTAEWRDEAVGPPVRVALSSIAATVTGVGWPLAGPLDLRLTGRPSGGGELQLAGRFGVTPFSTDVHVVARAVDLAPYEPYLGTPMRLRAWTDLDLAVAMPSPNAPVTVRGQAALANVEVRDGERTVFSVERAAATGLQVEWPRRVTAAQLSLRAPWVLVERDQRGAMAMRALLPTGANGTTRPAASSEKAPPSEPLLVKVGVLSVEEGGARVVDQSVTPPAAVDLRRLAVRVEGLSTPPGPRAQFDLKGQTGSGAALALRGRRWGPWGGHSSSISLAICAGSTRLGRIRMSCAIWRGRRPRVRSLPASKDGSVKTPWMLAWTSS